jgi:hypothetical protein
MTARRPTANDPVDAGEEFEIEVTPLPTLRKPRAINPEVDNVIASGEIQPRSLIIRSSDSLTRMPVREDATEPSLVPNMPIAAPRRGLHWLWLAAAIVPAVLGGMLMTKRPAAAPAPNTMGVQAAAEMIETALDAEGHAAQLRVEAIASSSMLRAGIETDPQTLADMARDKDVVFTLEPGEALEVFQLHDGTRSSMLRMPTAAPAITPATPGKPRLDAHGGALTIVATSQVAKDSKVSGEVSLSIPINLDSIKRRLTDQTLGASLAGLASPVIFVPDSGKSATNVVVAIETKRLETKPVSLVALIATPVAPSGSSFVTARYACFGASGLLLLVFLVSLVRSRR